MAQIKEVEVKVTSNIANVANEAESLVSSLNKIDATSSSTANGLNKVSSANNNLATSAKASAISVLENGGAMGLLNDATGGVAMTIKDAVESFALFGQGTSLATLKQTIFTAVVGTSTGALKAFKIALATTGVGALIVALGYFVTKMSEATEATEDEAKAQELLKLSIDATVSSYKQLRDESDQYVNAARLRAEIAGKSAKDLLQIDLDASEERRRILKDEENALFLKQQNQRLGVDENKKINDRLVAINRERLAELDKQEILRLQFEKTVADKRRSDNQAAEDKLAQDRANKRKAKSDERLAELKNIEEKEKEAYDREQNLLAERNKAELSSLDEIDKARRQNELNNMSAQEAELSAIEDSYKQRIDAAVSFGQDTLELEIAKANALNEVNLKYQQQSYDQEKANKEAKIKLSEEEARAKIDNAQFAANALSAISDIVGQDTVAGKALAIAGATISTYLSAQKAYESQFKPLAIVDSPVRGAIAAGIAVAQGLANVKRIASVRVPGKSGGGGAGQVPSGGASGAAVPNFNVVGNSGVNQLAGVIAGKEQTPVKAYVVTREVTSGQSLDRNTIDGASLG